MKKTKKAVLAAAACLAVLTAAFGLAACDKGNGGTGGGHNWSSDWTYDSENVSLGHWHVCNDDGCTEVSGTSGHTWTDDDWAADADNPGNDKRECPDCHATETRPTPHTHAYTEWTIAEDDLPTDETEGTAKRVCKGSAGACEGAVLEYILPVLDSSDYTVETLSELTCLTDGIVKYTLVTDDPDDEDITFEIVTESTGEEHDWNEDYEIYQPASCTKDGVEGYLCSHCGKIKEGSERTITHTGHVWDEEPTVDVEPTCESQGVKSIHCKNCAEYKDLETINPLGHEWGDIETFEATCEEDGMTFKSCNNDSSHIQIVDSAETAPATGHEWGEWELGKAPTADSSGYLYRRCTHDKTHIETLPLATLTAANTSFYEVDDSNAATCTSEGSVKYTLTHINYYDPDTKTTEKKLPSEIEKLAGSKFAEEGALVFTVESGVTPHNYVWEVGDTNASAMCKDCEKTTEVSYDKKIAAEKTVANAIKSENYKLEPGSRYYLNDGGVSNTNGAYLWLSVAEAGQYTFNFTTIAGSTYINNLTVVKTASIGTTGTKIIGTSATTFAGVKAKTVGGDDVSQLTFTKSEGSEATFIFLQFMLNKVKVNNVAVKSQIVISVEYSATVTGGDTEEPEPVEISTELKKGDCTVKLDAANVVPEANTEGWVFVNTDSDAYYPLSIAKDSGLTVYIKESGEWVKFLSEDEALSRSFRSWRFEEVEFYFSGAAGTYTVNIGNALTTPRGELTLGINKVMLKSDDNIATNNEFGSTGVAYKFTAPKAGKYMLSIDSSSFGVVQLPSNGTAHQDRTALSKSDNKFVYYFDAEKYQDFTFYMNLPYNYKFTEKSGVALPAIFVLNVSEASFDEITAGEPKDISLNYGNSSAFVSITVETPDTYVLKLDVSKCGPAIGRNVYNIYVNDVKAGDLQYQEGFENGIWTIEIELSAGENVVEIKNGMLQNNAVPSFPLTIEAKA
ncbi:MAG: hypothetical protein NC033_03150 [Clostridiales bacterium]|nr:hypothetical protein [Clostridiales bacterium]